MKFGTSSIIARQSALLVLLALMALPAYAGRYSGTVWQNGDGRWYYGIRDGSCKKTADCVEGKGFTTSKKEARKEARKAAKKANKEDEESLSRGEEPGGGA